MDGYYFFALYPFVWTDQFDRNSKRKELRQGGGTPVENDCDSDNSNKKKKKKRKRNKKKRERKKSELKKKKFGEREKKNHRHELLNKWRLNELLHKRRDVRNGIRSNAGCGRTDGRMDGSRKRGILLIRIAGPTSNDSKIAGSQCARSTLAHVMIIYTHTCQMRMLDSLGDDWQ